MTSGIRSPEEVRVEEILAEEFGKIADKVPSADDWLAMRDSEAEELFGLPVKRASERLEAEGISVTASTFARAFEVIVLQVGAGLSEGPQREALNAVADAVRSANAWQIAKVLCLGNGAQALSGRTWRLIADRSAERPDRTPELALSAVLNAAEGHAFVYVRNALGSEYEADGEARSELAKEVGTQATHLLRELGFGEVIDGDKEALVRVLRSRVKDRRAEHRDATKRAEADGLEPPPPLPDPDEPLRLALETYTSDGILEFDAIFARFLSELGPNGSRASEAVLRAARERSAKASKNQLAFQYEGARPTPAAIWRLWFEPSRSPFEAPWLGLLTRAVWLDVVQPRLSRRAQIYPATVLPVAEDHARLGSRRGRLIEAGGQIRLLTDDGEPAALVMPADDLRELATVDAQLAEFLAHRSATVLGSSALFPITRWLQWAAHEQAVRGSHDTRRIAIGGGFAELAQLAGTLSDGASKKAREREGKRAREVVRALAHWQWNLPDGSTGNLLAYRYKRPHRGRRAELVLTLSDPWLPGYAAALKAGSSNTRSEREARRLAPVLRHVPELVGRGNEHGALFGLAQLLVIEMRKRAAELVKHGGVAFNKAQVAELAKRVDLPEKLAQRQFSAWRDGADPETGAPVATLLKPVGRRRITLSDREAGARSFLEEAGKKAISGSERAKRAKKHRGGRKR